MEKEGKKKLRFAIFGNVYQAKKSASIQKILSYLSEREADVFMEREFYDFVTKGQHLEVQVTRVFEGNDFEADFVISMGGDGTLLKSAHFVGNKGIPIMGVNMGRLGFLADVSPQEIESAIDALYRGEYDLEDHAVIQAELEGQQLQTCPRALNDIAVLKVEELPPVAQMSCTCTRYVLPGSSPLMVYGGILLVTWCQRSDSPVVLL